MLQVGASRSCYVGEHTPSNAGGGLAVDFQVFQSLGVGLYAHGAFLELGFEILEPKVGRFENVTVGVYDLGGHWRDP